MYVYTYAANFKSKSLGQKKDLCKSENNLYVVK